MSVEQPGSSAVDELPAASAAGIAPVITQAQEAFRRDLPRLLRERPGQWVAYQGDSQVGFGTTKTAIYQECLRQGYERGSFLVRLIQPDPDEFDFLGPVDLS